MMIHQRLWFIVLVCVLPALAHAEATVTVPAEVSADPTGAFSIDLEITATGAGDTIETISFVGEENISGPGTWYDYGCSISLAPGETFSLTHPDQLLSFNLNGSITVRVDFCGLEPQFLTVVVVHADPSVPLTVASWSGVKARYR